MPYPIPFFSFAAVARWLFSLLLIIPLLWPGSTLARVEETRVPQGTYWRIVTAQGVLRVLRPKTYTPDGAAVVVYVHGFHTSIDRTWEKNDLSAQFAQSRQNAIFIGVDGPRDLTDHVKFGDLEDLLRLVSQETGLQLPRGHLSAMGHSGGYWTIANWLEHKDLECIILLDGLYGFVNEYARWIDGKSQVRRRRMIFVARGTRRLSSRFVRGRPGVASRSGVPARYAGFSRAEQRARIVHIESQYSHRGIVSSRRVIPVVLGFIAAPGD